MVTCPADGAIVAGATGAVAAGAAVGAATAGAAVGAAAGAAVGAAAGAAVGAGTAGAAPPPHAARIAAPPVSMVRRRNARRSIRPRTASLFRDSMVGSSLIRASHYAQRHTIWRFSRPYSRRCGQPIRTFAYSALACGSMVLS